MRYLRLSRAGFVAVLARLVVDSTLLLSAVLFVLSHRISPLTSSPGKADPGVFSYLARVVPLLIQILIEATGVPLKQEADSATPAYLLAFRYLPPAEAGEFGSTAAARG